MTNCPVVHDNRSRNVAGFLHITQQNIVKHQLDAGIFFILPKIFFEAKQITIFLFLYIKIVYCFFEGGAAGTAENIFQVL